MRVSPRLPWYCLLSAVVLVPLAVGVLPLSGVHLTLNVFVQAKLIALALTVGLALGSWALITLKDGALYTGKSLIPLAVFIAVATASAAFGLDRRIAVFGDAEQGVGLLVFMLCTLAAFLVTQLVRGEKALTDLTSAVVFTAAGIAVVGLLQQLAAFDILGVWGEGMPTYLIRRGFGTIGNADTYAAYLVIPAILAFARVRHAEARGELIKWGACLVAILGSAVASQTRGPLLGLVVGLAVYVVVERNIARQAANDGKKKSVSVRPARSTWLVVVAGVALGLLLAAVLAGGDEFSATFRDFSNRFLTLEAYTSLGGRLPLWAAAVRIMAAHPLLGVGPDSFRLGWYPVRELSTVQNVGLVITDPHSYPLLIGATMGVAGLAAALYLSASTLMAGYRTARGPGAARSGASDYRAWFAGTLALLVAMLVSLAASSTVFMLFVGFGVLLAPGLSPTPPADKRPTGVTVVRVASCVVAAVLVVFAALTAFTQIAAATADAGDLDAALAQISRAAALAPWDSGIRDLRYQTTVQAALERAFGGAPDAAEAIDAAEQALARAAAREPYEYLHHYRMALLLIAAGQKLGDQYTERGIEAGLRGLELYPSSVELRTGIASGYLQLNQPSKAEALVRDVWTLDPNYARAGITYVQALDALGKDAEAASVLSELKQRFPDDPAVDELQTGLTTD